MRLSPSAIEDVYALSPAQRGMLLAAASSDDPGLHYEQAFCELANPPSASRLRDAWEWLVTRHSALRTSFRWRGLSSPVQVVHKDARPQLTELDWRGLDTNAVGRELQALLAREQAVGIELEQAPLLRLTLAHTRNAAWFVLGIHHLVHDAWSIQVLLNELACYLAGESSLPAPRPYVEYVRYMATVDRAAATNHWRRYLGDWAGPGCSLANDVPLAQPATCLIEEMSVSAARSEALLSTLRERNLTLYTAVSAAWALLVATETGRSEVLFGSTVAGRPIDLAGAERMVGPFINVVPRRVGIARARVGAWLEALQHADMAARPFELLPTTEIARAGGASSTLPFGTVVVMQNAFDESGVAVRRLAAQQIGSFGRSNVPLTLRVTPGPALRLELLSPGRIARPRLRSLLHRLASVLCSLPDLVEDNVSDLTERAGPGPRDGTVTTKSSGAWRTVRPTALNGTVPDIVDVEIPAGPLRYPVVVTAKRKDLELSLWAAANRDWVEGLVRDIGGVLLRGFPPLEPPAFADLVKGLYPALLEYKDRSTPRTALGGRIYTSTEYPAHQSIALHNEFSYATSWPQRIAFCCVQPSDTGGETPLADAHLVYSCIPDELKARFERHRVMYIRNYGTGVDLPWQEAFQTTDRAEVSAYCATHGIEAEWLDAERLRTRQLRAACVAHPTNGARLWFNQAHLFHVSNLAPEVRAAMTRMFTENDLPRDARFGDGSAISDHEMAGVREAYRASTVAFPWQRGDVLLLDNMRIAHGRNAFTGPRKVIVGMSEPYTPAAVP